MLVHFQLSNNNETKHPNQIYEGIQLLEHKNMRKSHKSQFQTAQNVPNARISTKRCELLKDREPSA